MGTGLEFVSDKEYKELYTTKNNIKECCVQYGNQFLGSNKI